MGLPIESLHHDIQGGQQTIQKVKLVQNYINREGRT